ncbi:hypothetical protein BH10ACI1_BH10ACI1_14390 [soil metagenome]
MKKIITVGQTVGGTTQVINALVNASTMVSA